MCQERTLLSCGSKKFSMITSIDLKVNFRDMLGCGTCITGMLRDKKMSSILRRSPDTFNPCHAVSGDVGWYTMVVQDSDTDLFD